MDHTFFFLFSFIEFTAMLTLILSLFLFNLRAFRSHILFSAFMLTQASYLLRIGAEFASFAMFVQLIMIVLFFRLMFQIQWFYASLMGVIGYIVYVIMQATIILITSLITPYSFSDIVNSTPDNIGYVVQTLTAIFSLLLAWLLLRVRIGFSFIPDTESVKVHLNFENLLFLSIMSLGVLTMLTLYNVMYASQLNAIIFAAILVIQTAVMLYLALRKEKSHD